MTLLQTDDLLRLLWDGRSIRTGWRVKMEKALGFQKDIKY